MQKTKRYEGYLRYALPPVLGLVIAFGTFAGNIGKLDLQQPFIPALICAGIGVIALALGFLLGTKRAVVVGMVLTLSFLLWYNVAVRFVALGLLVWYLGWEHRNTEAIENFAGKVFGVMLIISMVIVTINIPPQIVEGKVHGVAASTQTRNIFYIVPDRFPSRKVLLEMGYDNTAFIGDLREMGFYVREDAELNTISTIRCVASVLNGWVVTPEIKYGDARDLIHVSTVGEMARDYDKHNIGSWWGVTHRMPMFTNHIYKTGTALDWFYDNELVTGLMDRSALRLIPALSAEQYQRNMQLYQAKELVNLAKEDRVFVFAHFLLPHPPYIWTVDGNPQTRRDTAEELYLDQIEYCEGFYLDLLKRIIAESEEPPIIVFMADEGAVYNQGGADFAESLEKRQGIMLAWYGLDGDLGSIPPERILIEALK